MTTNKDWSWKGPEDTFKRSKKSKKKHKAIRIAKQKNKLFYDSDDWKRLRYKVLSTYKAECMCCGRSYKKHGVVIHVDHIKPRSKYPARQYDFDNLQILCEDCNIGKSNTDETDWRNK